MIPFASQAPAPEPLPESAPRASPRSPGLALFQKSPFRLLRLSVHAPEEEALWKASRILAQLRARLPLAEPDLVSWLPPGDELDTQAASQRMEEPLQRVMDQLFWFDLTGAAALEEALVRRDHAGLMKYLDEPAPLHVASPPGSQHEEEMSRAERAAFAHRVNQANLHLLLGFSRLRLGSAAFAGVPGVEPSPEPRAPAPLKWKSASGVSTVGGAHRILGGCGTDEEDAWAEELREDAWAELLTAGLIDWRTLLSDPRFGAYTSALLRAAGLDSEPGEHDEAVAGAIRTALAEAVAGELKLALAEGGTHVVSRLAAVARAGARDDEQWRLSFRSLHGLFKSELAELDDLVADSTASLSSIELYLRRLERLLARWRALDPDDLLGLAELGDSGINRAFAALNHTFRPSLDTRRLETALEKAWQLAASASLRERLAGTLAALREPGGNRLCQFCRKRPQDPETPVLISGKKVTDTDNDGNTITTHYALRAAAIPRCKPCAAFHEVRRTTTIAVAIAFIPLVPTGLVLGEASLEGIAVTILPFLAVPVLIAIMLRVSIRLSILMALFAVGAWMDHIESWDGGVLALLGLAAGAALIVGWLCRRRLRAVSVPPELPIRDLAIPETDAGRELAAENFGSLRADYSRRAIARWNSRHG